MHQKNSPETELFSYRGIAFPTAVPPPPALLGRGLMTFPESDRNVRPQRKNNHQQSKHLGHRNRSAGNKKSIRADSLDDKTSQSVPAQVEQTDFSVKLFMLPEKEQHD